MLDYEVFFAEEYEAVVRALTLAFGNRMVAEDAAQEAFGRALARWPRVAQMERPAGWVYVVAVRFERRRNLRRRLPTTTRHEASVPDEAGAIADRITLVGLLNSLTGRQRQTVVLRYLADLTLEDVASALGCRVGTVKATLHQALIALQRSAEKDRNATI